MKLNVNQFDSNLYLLSDCEKIIEGYDGQETGYVLSMIRKQAFNVQLFNFPLH